jgi:hypothetical protein
VVEHNIGIDGYAPRLHGGDQLLEILLVAKRGIDEAQILRYLERNSANTCPLITPQHVRQLMMVLAGRQLVEGAHFPGDRVMHWRRRAQEAA